MQLLPVDTNCFFLLYKKEEMPSLSTKERKAKLRASTKERKARRHIVIKELNDELSNLTKIQYETEKIYPIKEQQLIEIDELYDEIWKFDEIIKSLEILSTKNNVKEEIELIEATKK